MLFLSSGDGFCSSCRDQNLVYTGIICLQSCQKRFETVGVQIPQYAVA
jgi:hypothetical protein